MLWRTPKGKQTSLTFSGPDAKRLAEGFAQRLDLDGQLAARAWLSRQGHVESTGGWTVDSWLAHYIAHLTSVTEGTRAEYRRLYGRTYGKEHIDGRRLGAMALGELGRDVASAATNALAKRLSQKSVLNAKGLMFEAFANAAERADVPVTVNPFHKIKLPAAGDDEVDEVKHYLTHDEFDQLFLAIPAYWRPLTLTLVSTGMRWGEATALPVGEVRLGDAGHAPALRVMKAWKHGETGRVLGSPKTKKSRRTIVLPPELVDVLRPLVAGRPRDALVFTNRTGVDPILSWNFHDNVWRPALRRLQRCAAHRDEKVPCMSRADRLPSCDIAWTFTPRVHDLRHTHVAWLMAEGVPIEVIQQRLGHESIKTTIDTYGHLMPDVQVAAQAAASAALQSLRSLHALGSASHVEEVFDAELVE